MKYCLVFVVVLIYLKGFEGAPGNEIQATDTIQIKGKDEVTLIVAWNDTKFDDGGEFSMFQSVEISYKDVEDPSASNTTTTVAREEYGVELNLDTSKVYMFLISYKDPGLVTSYPIVPVLRMSADDKREVGIYDLLLKAPPTDDWRYYTVGWMRLSNSQTWNSADCNGFEKKNFISHYAIYQFFSNFLVGMKDSSGIVRWDMMLQQASDTTLQNVFSQSWSFSNVDAQTESLIKTYGPDAPSISYYNSGESIGIKRENRIMYGIDRKKGGERFLYGFGLNRSPYVGSYEGKDDTTTEFTGYILGKRHQQFIVSTTEECSGCGSSTYVKKHNCKISHAPWRDIFCVPYNTGQSCAVRECPFDIPSNLGIGFRWQTKIMVKWDAYDLNTFYAPHHFTIILKVFNSNGSPLQEVSLDRYLTQYDVTGLTAFTEYSFSIAGHSSFGGDFLGNFSELVHSKTKQGKPNGTATSFEALTVNSSCVKLKWEHIDEVNVIGILQTYRLTYRLNGGIVGVLETGIVTEYLVCNLLPYSEYEFRLKAKNEAHLATVFVEAIYITEESVPDVAPSIILTEAASNTSIAITWDTLAPALWNGEPHLYYVFYRVSGTDIYKNVTASGSSSGVNIDGLEYSYTLYDLQVAAATIVGIGPRSNITTQRSGEYLPLSPPLDVIGEDVNATTINVRWIEVPEHLRKGVILSYTATCYSSDLSQIVQVVEVKNGLQLTTNINNLDAFTWYAVAVTAFTSVGAGPESNATFIRSGIGVPDAFPLNLGGHNLSSTSIFLRWDNISIDEWNGASVGFILSVSPSPSSFIGGEKQYDRGMTSVEITDLEKFKKYSVNIRCYNNEGSGPRSPTIIVSTDEARPLKYEDTVSGEHTGSYSIIVRWNLLYGERLWLGYPYQYHVYYRRNGKPEFTNETVVDESKLQVEIEGLEGFREYEVAVAAATIKGVGPYSDVKMIKTGEAAPTGPPQNLSGGYNDSHSIYVNWTEVLEEDKRGVITKYLVICTTKDLIEKGRENISSNSTLATVFDGLEIYTPYLVTVAAYTVIGLGPSTEPIEVWTDAEAPFRGPYNLTGYNTSSTSIRVDWDDISEWEWAGVIGNFHLIIQSVKDPNDKNMTNITRIGNQRRFMYEAKDLMYFTDYKIEVGCFNVKGMSSFSNITVKTEESWAIITPPNLGVVATSFNVLNITWDLPDVLMIPGVIRGYTVRVQAMYTEEDLTVGIDSAPRQRRSISSSLCSSPSQFCDGLPLEMENTTVLGADSLNLNISHLRGNTVYNITISVDTKFFGLSSPPVQITTPEGTPRLSAFNLTCQSLGYSSLLLQWKHAPPAYLEGIRTEYMIYYQVGNKIVNESDQAYKRSMVLFFLQANTQYTMWLTAFTAVGEGLPTPKLNCSTSDTAPTAAPMNVIASSFHYPYASLIQWDHIPNDKWHGSKLGYTIFYERLSSGEIDAEIPIITNFTEVHLTTTHILTGLKLYSVYRIRIAARTRAGTGFRSDPVLLETCHVPQPQILLNYVVYPPYVDKPKGNNWRPGGILMDLTEQMLLSCAHVCHSFNTNISITYNAIDVDHFSDIKNLTFNGTQVQVPRVDTGKFTPDYSLIITTTSPGFILLEVPDDSEEAAAKTEGGLLDGIISTLPLCVLYFVLNWLFGALFWFCEPTKVERQGTGISICGIFEGFYLAIMTSTTVGYGDKVPETTQGRLYIVFWTLLGLVLTGIVTGSLSSSLSVAAINSMKQTLPDDKVLALYGTPEYTYGKKKIKKFESNITYYTYEELFEPLKNRSVKYALLDRYVAEVLKTNISDYGLGVNKAFDIPTDFGVAAYGELKKLKVCGTKFAKANADITAKAITKLLKELEEAKAKKAGTNTSSSSTLIVEESVDMISFEAPLYRKALQATLMMWLGFIVLGLIYEVIRRRRIKKLKNKVYTEKGSTATFGYIPGNDYSGTKEILLLWQKELREFVSETLSEFQETMDRVDEKLNTLDYKHGKQLLKLRTELSKLYGVNFKYVKPSELGLPLEKILEYKEDMKNRPKEPLFVRFRRFRVAVVSRFSRVKRLLSC